MNITPEDQIEALYEIITAIPGISGLTGEVHKGVRPDDSKLEDVVINSLPVLPGSIHMGTANVNIYVPDVQIAKTAKYNSYFAKNSVRIMELKNLILPHLTDKVFDGKAHLFVALQSTIREPESKSHFLNLRVSMRWHDVAL